MTKAKQKEYRVIELYTEVVPNEGGFNPHYCQESVVPSTAEPSQPKYADPYPDIIDWSPAPQVDMGYKPYKDHHTESDVPDVAKEDYTEENVDRVEDGDEDDSVWLGGDDLGDDVSDVMESIPQRGKQFPQSGRSNSHLVPAFNDVLARTCHIFGTGTRYDSPLSKDHHFVSKNHLHYVENEFHINANIEIKWTPINKSKMIIECKEVHVETIC